MFFFLMLLGGETNLINCCADESCYESGSVGWSEIKIKRFLTKKIVKNSM